jgi:hypothetical protein
MTLSSLLLGAGLMSCSTVRPVVQPAEPSLAEASEAEEFEPFRDAVNRATQASDLTQAAETPQDWQQVASLWQDAINLMKAVPESHPRYEVAQQRSLEQYPKNLEYAQSKAGDLAVPDLTLEDDKLTQVDFGEGWPFTIDGEVECERVNAGNYDVALVTLQSVEQTYAVNSPAQARAAERGWRDIAEIWRDDASGSGKVPLQWVVMRGEAQCSGE